MGAGSGCATGAPLEAAAATGAAAEGQAGTGGHCGTGRVQAAATLAKSHAQRAITSP